MELAISRQQENTKLGNWIQKHAFEALIGLMLAIGGAQGALLFKNSNRLSVLETKVEHINKAVNNADENEPTMRELVETLSDDVVELKENIEIITYAE